MLILAVIDRVDGIGCEVQRVAPRLPLLLLNAFKLMCLFCVPGTHDQKSMVVPFISTCYFARVAVNTLCDVGFTSRGLRFRVTHILGVGVPMTWDSIESWINSHILSSWSTCGTSAGNRDKCCQDIWNVHKETSQQLFNDCNLLTDWVHVNEPEIFAGGAKIIPGVSKMILVIWHLNLTYKWMVAMSSVLKYYFGMCLNLSSSFAKALMPMGESV
jgi:hypothetical protein